MSTPQPPAQESDWPVTWYAPATADTPPRLKCLARRCTYIFSTPASIRYRYNHWQHFYYNPEMSTDHTILRYLNNQRNCPYCAYSINKDALTIRDLFRHELDVHDSTNTTNIHGIVTLVRERRFRSSTDELQQKIWERMCQIVKTKPEYRVLLRYCHLPSDTDTTISEENMKSLLAPEALRPRQRPEDPNIPPFYTPFPAEAFLSHLEPKPEDKWAKELDWDIHWNSLRIMYSYGVI